MNLNSAFWAIIAFFEMLDNASLTKCVQALRDCGGLDKIAFTDITSDVWIEFFDKAPSLGCH